MFVLGFSVIAATLLIQGYNFFVISRSQALLENPGWLDFSKFAIMGAPVFVLANVFFLSFFTLGSRTLPYSILTLVSVVAAMLCSFVIDRLLGSTLRVQDGLAMVLIGLGLYLLLRPAT